MTDTFVKRGQFDIAWIDRHREPQVAPNPNYPEGIDLDLTDNIRPSCATALPYPAPRCGIYVIECRFCGARVGCTTAGRPDDPRSIKFACGSKMVMA